jgi:predicted Zn-dependent peptidase
MTVDRSRLPSLGPEPIFTFPEIQKASLANGLDVWTVEHRDVPVLTFVLLMPAGSAVDPPALPGTAAVAADMLDEGSGERSAIEMQAALAGIGAQLDIDVGPDATVLSLTTLPRFAAEALSLLASVVQRPRFDAGDFARVRELRLHRFIQLRDQAPAVADRAFAEAAYPGHPYGHLPFGTEDGVRALTLDDLVAFHARHHVAPGATLVAAGDAAHTELLDAIGSEFGAWPSGVGGTDPVSQAPPVPSEAAPTSVVLVHRAGAAQSELRLGHPSAHRTTPDYHALLVLNMVLGGQFVSRINLNLRERKGYTYGARTYFDFRRGVGPFVVQTAVQTDATASAIQEILGELRGVRGERPVTAEELEQAKAGLTRGYPRGFETAEQIARGAAQIALYGLPDDYFSRFAPRVHAVDADTVARVANTYLRPDRMVTVVVGDRDRIGTSLAAIL